VLLVFPDLVITDRAKRGAATQLLISLPPVLFLLLVS